MGYYANAEVCLKGHIISTSTNHVNHENFCSKCGSKTITVCPHCGAKIRGDYNSDSFLIVGQPYTLPSYCYNCGKPYPWIENNIKKLNTLLLIDTVLSEDEKGIIKEYFPDLIIEDDTSTASAVLIKTILDRTNGVVKNFVIEVVKSLAIDNVKKIFGL